MRYKNQLILLLASIEHFLNNLKSLIIDNNDLSGCAKAFQNGKATE